MARLPPKEWSPKGVHEPVGRRVELVRDVERYPDFIAERGRTGTIVRWEPDMIAVRMDEPLKGSEEWDNQVHWNYDDVREFPLDTRMLP